MTSQDGRLFYTQFKTAQDLPSQVRRWEQLEIWLNDLILRAEGPIGGGESTSGGGAPSAGEGGAGDTHYEATGIYLEIDGTWTLVFTKYTDAEVDTIVATHTAIAGAHHAKYATADHDAETHNAAALADVEILTGTGTPEAAVTAGIGALFLRTDGGAGTTLYVKESGVGNTGWIGK